MNSTFLAPRRFQMETAVYNLTTNQSGTEDTNTSLYDVLLVSFEDSHFYELGYGFSTSEKYVVGSVYALITLLGIVLNLLTIFIVALGTNIGKEFKIQLINLAIADITLALIVPAYMAVNSLDISFPDSSILCKIFCFATHAASYTSLLCNVAISLERFVIIYFPFRASRYRKRHKLLVIAAVWIVGALPGIGTLMFADVIQIRNNFYCVDVPVPEPLEPALRTLKYAAPAFVIVLVYTLVFIKLCFQKSNDIQINSSNTWKKVLDKVIINFVTFELTYLVFISCICKAYLF